VGLAVGKKGSSYGERASLLESHRKGGLKKRVRFASEIPWTLGWKVSLDTSEGWGPINGM